MLTQPYLDTLLALRYLQLRSYYQKSNTLQKASLRNHVCSRFNDVNNMHDARDRDIRVLWHLAWRPRIPS